VQIVLILVPKAKIRRKICRKIHWFSVDFPADFSFNGLKPKDLNIKRLIATKKKDIETKTRNLQGRK
jgi:hypothetical protein